MRALLIILGLVVSITGLSAFDCGTPDGGGVVSLSSVDTLKAIIIPTAYAGDIDSLGGTFELDPWWDKMLLYLEPWDTLFEDSLYSDSMKWSLSNYYYENSHAKFVVWGGLHPHWTDVYGFNFYVVDEDPEDTILFPDEYAWQDTVLSRIDACLAFWKFINQRL